MSADQYTLIGDVHASSLAALRFSNFGLTSYRRKQRLRKDEDCGLLLQLWKQIWE